MTTVVAAILERGGKILICRLGNSRQDQGKNHEQYGTHDLCPSRQLRRSAVELSIGDGIFGPLKNGYRRSKANDLYLCVTG